MSAALWAALFTRIADDNRMVTYATMGIARDFKPVEWPLRLLRRPG